MGPVLNIFAIYTLEDSALMQDIVQRIKPSSENVQVAIWNDDPILKGQTWKPQNVSNLEKSDIFLFFISNALMHSQFVQQLEFKTIIDNYKEGKSKVIPVLIDDCPWDTVFEADEYTFSFKELRVLPENQKPIKKWNSEEKAYKSIVAGIRFEIPELFEKEANVESKVEEQTALSFKEEKETDVRNEEIDREQEEAEAKRKLAEEKTRLAEIEEKRKAETIRLQEEMSRRNANAQRIKARADEESLKLEVESKRKLEEERVKKEKFETMRRAEADRVAKLKEESQEQKEEPKEGIFKSKMLKVAGIAALITLSIWTISKFTGSSEEKPVVDSQIKFGEIKDSVTTKESEIKKVKKEPASTKLAIGDFHEGGMVFSLEKDNNSGMIVHLEDAGPMTWEDAIQIQKQLGEGWRLPTFNELLLLHKTVGQGDTNAAEFSDGLYWSASDYDQYQARLLRFRDANKSYHYNKVAEHRKYKVRAIRDFTR